MRITKLLMLAMVGTLSLPTSYGVESSEGGSISAKINGQPLMREEILKQINALVKKRKGTSQLTEEEKQKAYKGILEQMIQMRLLVNEALRLGIENQADFQQALKEQKESLLLQFFLKKTQENMSKNVSIEKIKTLMKSLSEKEEQVTIHQMIVKDKNTAERIKKAVESGKNFTQLAKEYSIDKGAKTVSPPVALSLLPESLQKIIASLKPGQLVVLPAGPKGEMIVFQLAKREKLTDPKMLERMAYAQIESEYSQNLMKDLYNKSKIERFDQEGNPVSAPELFK